MKKTFRLTFFLFLALTVFGQFDNVPDRGSALNLALSVTDTNGLHREFSATVTNQFVVGSDCRDTIHAVTNVQLNNGPQNSGTYFSLTLTRTASNGTLTVLFGPNTSYYSALEVVGGTTFFDAGFCSAATCTFRYYCDIYEAQNPLEVYISSGCNQGVVNFYDLSVTQYVETIQIIPASRTLIQSSPVVNPFNANNLGPANFVHYYHDLQPTVAEAGKSSRLYIEAINWSTSSSGTAYICVSYSAMVATTSSLSQVAPFSGNIDTAPITVTSINEPTDCPISCSAGTITGSGSVIFAVPACNNDCGFQESIWIGVRAPSASVGSTYTMRVRFRDFSVPDLVTINVTPAVSDGALVEKCNGEEGDFGCDDYYEITYASVGSPAVANRKVGPFLAVELFGVYNGIAKLEVADGFIAGKTSLCPGCEPFGSCTVCDDPTTRTSCSNSDCWAVVQPCKWNSNLSNDWVFTVSAVTQDDVDTPIEYGVRASIGSWPLTTITPTAWETGQPNFGKVLVNHYSHYQVTFTDTQIFDDSYFEVELYSNYDDDVIGFAWNFNEFADDGTCYGSDGKCATNTNCADGAIGIGSCRFAFVKCPISFSYDEYFGSVVPTQVSGSKFSELQAGTYYFAVWGIHPGSVSYNNAIEYTIYWNYHRALPVYDQVTYNNFVYYGDYSPQYKFVVPEDDNIYEIRFRISDTQSGSLQAYVRCGELAGDCPCWNHDRSCSSGGSNLYDCDIVIDRCGCESGIYYLSVLGVLKDDSHPTKPITYSVTPYLSRFSNFNQLTVINPISASRAISPIITTISDHIDDIYSFNNAIVAERDNTRIYRISLNNVDISDEDALLATIKISPQELFGYDSLFPVSDPTSPLLVMTIFRDNLCQRLKSCSIQANAQISLSRSEYNSGYDSHCTITLQPCYFDAGGCISNDCEPTSVNYSFSQNSTYYLSIANFGTPDAYMNPITPDAAYIEAVQYTLNVQIVDQSAYALTNGVPFFGDVSRSNYVHFSFDVSQAPADNRLVFSLYGDHDQRYPLRFYINYDAKAGSSTDCYDHTYPCYVCTLYSLDFGTDIDGELDHCYYEITPCELSRRTGTYYVSVYGIFQTNNDQALFTVQASYFPTIALLDTTGFGVPTPGNVRQRSSAYYSVTVPTLVSGNIVGRVLSIDVEAVIKGQIYVTITQMNPDNQCDCAKDGHVVTASVSGNRDDINWKRYNCELTSGEIYYISVEADQDAYCDPTGFVIHAKLQNIISIPITLSSVDSRIIGSFDSNNTSSGLVLEYNQFTALTFTTNAPVGAVLDIVISEASSLFTDVLPFDVFLSIGSVYTPSGTNDDDGGLSVGPQPNQDNCPALVTSCKFLGTANEQCRLFIDACDVPQGSVTWFLTFSGELLPLNRESEVINVAIRLIAPEAIINTPAISTYGPVQTTGLQFEDTINRSFGKSHFTTSAALGINAGDRVTFSVSVNADLYVSYETETNTNGTCSFTCSASGAAPQCTVYACEAIAAGTWYFAIKSSSPSTTATFTVTRTQVENSTLSIASPSPLPFNTDSTFASLGANEWRYHTFAVSASTSSHFELTVSGGASASNIVYVSSPVWLPYLAIRSLSNNDVTLLDGEVGRTCGGSTSALPEATCCYDANTVTFAVIGSVAGYTLRVNLVEFAGNQVQSVSVPSNTTGTATLGRVNWYSFTQPAGTHLWFDFVVFTGAADLYLNSGSRAGSKASSFDSGDFGYCWGNDGLVGSALCSNTVSAGGFCDGFIASCNPCLASNSGYTFFFAVVPAPNATFALEVIAQTDRSIALGQNNGLEFPVPAGSLDLLDLRASTDSFSAYAHYFYDYSRTYNSIQNFIPVRDDPAVIDRIDYANLEIYIDNFRDSAGVATSTIPVRFYINKNGLAGAQSSSGCYSGRDITTGGSLLPCIENTGAAASNSTAIQCSINVCDLGNCGAVIYLSASRLTSGSVASFTYDIEITEDFNAVTEWVDIVNLQIGSGSFPFTYNGDNTTDVVYIRTTSPGVSNFADATSQYVLLSLTNVTGASGTTAVSFRMYSGDTCSQLSDSQPVCSATSGTGSCQALTDPCGNGDNFDKNAVTFIRVSRDSSDTGAWSFIFNAQVLTVAPIDTTLTSLSPALTATSRSSYSAVKGILDFTWHFYEIFVTPSDGYSSLDVEIKQSCCTSPIQNIQIYYSWEDAGSGEVFDNARPNRWASDSCYVFNDVPDSLNTISNYCNFWGGAYRIGIFAPKGLQLFPDPILGEIYPALYSIDVSVQTKSHGVVALECPTSQVTDSSEFEPRWELYVPAENRGSQLTFFASLDAASSGDDVVLWVSKNSNPWDSTFSQGICSWDTSIDGDYNCSTGSDASCVITVPPCEFDDGIWYLYIDASGDSSVTVTFGATLGAKKYTPTLDVRTTDVLTTSGIVFNSKYQYYRVLVNPADELSLLTAEIIDTGCNSGCDLELYLSAGPRGFASSVDLTDDKVGPACVDESTGCGPTCLCSNRQSGSDFDVIEWSTCEYPDVTSYFIGVTGFSSDLDPGCKYDLKVWGRPRFYADLPFNIETCSFTSCIQYWGITDATGNSDLTGAVVTIDIVNTGTVDMSVYLNKGSVGQSCGSEQVCAAGAKCKYTIDCISGKLFIGVADSEASSLCYGCSGIEYSIVTTSVVFTTFASLSLGSTGVNGPASFSTGTQFVVANRNVAYSIGTYGSAGCGAACLRVLDLNSQYFFSNAAGLLLSDVGTIPALSATRQAFTLSEPYFHFQVTPAAGIDAFTLYFDNVGYCACDGGSINSLGLYLRSSTVSPPFDGCYDCLGGTQLEEGSCPTSVAPLSFTCIEGQTYYFTISSCVSHTCDVTFTAFVEFGAPRVVIGGDHNTAFTAVSATNVNCGSASTSRFYVEVTDVLSVSLKEPHGSISSASVSVKPPGCSSSYDCNVIKDQAGVDSSCRAADCHVYSFATPGLYYVDVTNPLTETGDSSVVYVQVVNRWVDLSGSVSNSIIGQTRHFYRLSNAASAISIDLTISEGPSLTLIVFDDLVSPGSSLIAGFQETLQCAFGTCSIYIPSFAKHSLSDTFYIEIDSASVFGGVGSQFGDSAQYTRASNANAEKPTRYTLSATLGTANCAAPPSVGFCASDVEGGNVWSEINNSVWNYERPDLKDDEAECRFLDLVTNCPNPSEECRKWLKVFSCLESFPQCDASGFQMGVCRDVCLEVTNACGAFKAERAEFSCCSDRYIAGNDSTVSTCYNIPPPPPPPETFAPEPGSDISSVPPAFVVPVFSTIDVFLPDDFVLDNKAAVHIDNVSASSEVIFSCLLLLFGLVTLLF